MLKLVEHLRLPLQESVLKSSLGRFRSVDDTSSEVYFSMDFVPKFGPVGWLMGAIMMKPMMRRVTKDVLQGLAFHVVTGDRVGSEMPSAAALATAVD